MCVRCGTGRIAWCTDPNRHEPPAKPDTRVHVFLDADWVQRVTTDPADCDLCRTGVH